MENPPKLHRLLRFLLVVIGLVIFAGLIVYSSTKVRFVFDGKAHTEPVVTELSLSHSVQRLENGKLASRVGVTTQTGARIPCPT